MEPLKPVRLQCSVQNYDWGLVGEDSHVARLYSLNSRKEIEGDKPYAELWMGTHESGPSFVVEDGESKPLKSWISEHPRVLGQRVLEKWGSDLPFLFKVLSVAKALSIQAHPDKELAQLLHKSQPNIYKDSNHKPEMTVAITGFEVLCSFISPEELKDVLSNVPELLELIGDVDVDEALNFKDQYNEEKVKTFLQSIFTRIMSASTDAVSEAIFKLKSRLNMENTERMLTEKERLVLRLEKQYPADVGIIAAFFLNYVKINPGEALYLAANEPHAYVSGEGIEVMATSDNVVRAGLTPKYRDVQTLCSMLTYKQGSPEILRGIPVNPYTKKYIPPFDEFEVDYCCLPSGSSMVFSAIPGPSIFIVVAGEGAILTDSTGEDKIMEGDVFFVPAEIEFSMTAISPGDNNAAAARGLQLFRAGVNSRYFESALNTDVINGSLR